MAYKLVSPVIDLSVRQLCKHPYCNHPKGCPNYARKRYCPPDCRLISEIIDLRKDVFVIWNIFSFKEHCEKMSQRHPDWSKIGNDPFRLPGGPSTRA